MFKIVINGKEINFMKVLHLSVDLSRDGKGKSNYVIYCEPEDGFEKDHILFFDEDDIDEIIIQKPDSFKK